jgi:hypothetical protein
LKIPYTYHKHTKKFQGTKLHSRQLLLHDTAGHVQDTAQKTSDICNLTKVTTAECKLFELPPAAEWHPLRPLQPMGGITCCFIADAGLLTMGTHLPA